MPERKITSLVKKRNKVLRELKSLQKDLGVIRDKARDILYDVEELGDKAEVAKDDLQRVIDSISEIV